MKPHEFASEMTRLRARFGDKAFDGEFTKLIFAVVQELPYVAWVRIVDFFIGSRRSSQPPLLVDFREATERERQRALDQTATGAAKALTTAKPFQKGLKDHLAKHKCDSVMELVEMRRLEIQLKKSENPDYDPLHDPEWNKGDK